MRIGTWNLNARWDKRHQDLLVTQNCDILFLTEVPKKTILDGYHCHLSAGVMGRGQHWAGIFSREPIDELPDPHPASAAVRRGQVTTAQRSFRGGVAVTILAGVTVRTLTRLGSRS